MMLLAGKYSSRIIVPLAFLFIVRSITAASEITVSIFKLLVTINHTTNSTEKKQMSVNQMYKHVEKKLTRKGELSKILLPYFRKQHLLENKVYFMLLAHFTYEYD